MPKLQAPIPVFQAVVDFSIRLLSIQHLCEVRRAAGVPGQEAHADPLSIEELVQRDARDLFRPAQTVPLLRTAVLRCAAGSTGSSEAGDSRETAPASKFQRRKEVDEAGCLLMTTVIGYHALIIGPILPGSPPQAAVGHVDIARRTPAA